MAIQGIIMPGTRTSMHADRRRLVLEIVGSERIKSQYELQDNLAARGISVNQATLSRDIRALGLLKGKDGYELPSASGGPADDALLSLYSVVHAWLTSAQTASALVVAKTPPGGATPLAIAIERAGWPEVAGTIAGDDTVFVATRGSAEARRVAASLNDIKDKKRLA
ncbi:MAG: arginine repressor [Planctomycetes bacterium]|nr:arginine repressor [Planctomycetota bacterium]